MAYLRLVRSKRTRREQCQHSRVLSQLASLASLNGERGIATRLARLSTCMESVLAACLIKFAYHLENK